MLDLLSKTGPHYSPPSEKEKYTFIHASHVSEARLNQDLVKQTLYSNGLT